MLFAAHTSLAFAGMHLDVPVLASIDWAALVLAAAAMVATLRFHVGMLTVLGLSALAGLLWKLAV